MHDDDTGSAQQGGWQPPEYVSPWIPAAGPDDKDSGSSSRSDSGRASASDAPAGGEAAVPPATAHALGTPGDEPAHAIVRITPSHQIEEFFAAFCRIASSGRLNKAGLPKNPLQFAVLANYHRAEL